MFDTTHAHITTWVVAIILFFVAVGLHNAGKNKGMKIVHMILRLFYLLIILTGALLFWKHQGINPALYGIKGLVGIWVIGMFEMVLVRTKKGKSTNMFWILLVVSLLLVLYLGLRLPLGWRPFA
ncbi:YisL family protein [Rossellomorea aquimaris]|uniref:YisL family protein n=1 Tax=Rossellomorea aquimaris TaxID=189382 RepID=UPI001CD1DFD2|nr:YisL family protein [Rossellomorea aquimaris]MCA1059538.1 YisL family protein [Rossellomorea aquimaris]